MLAYNVGSKPVWLEPIDFNFIVSDNPWRNQESQCHQKEGQNFKS